MMPTHNVKIVADDAQFVVRSNYYDELAAEHRPPMPPPGTPSILAGLCAPNSGEMVVINSDGASCTFRLDDPSRMESARNSYAARCLNIIGLTQLMIGGCSDLQGRRGWPHAES